MSTDFSTGAFTERHPCAAGAISADPGEPPDRTFGLRRSARQRPTSMSHSGSTLRTVEEAIDSAARIGDRRLTFLGVNNFRDLGGYRTESGRATLWGRVFRSDSPHNFTAADLEVFDALGIQFIYDLRRDAERETDPGPRPCVHRELPSGPVFGTDANTLRDRDDGERWLFEDYCKMLEIAGPVFGDLFSRFAECDGPVMFHCMGGKDRTGMTAALLLCCLGVDRETVLDDYELTSRYCGPDQIPHVVDLFVSQGIAREAAMGILSTPRWAMENALDRLDSAYGGIELYLCGRGGMDPKNIESLRSRLVS
jgi:protein-tyrosine phosphatase